MEKMATSIAFVSGKGGVGKTALTANFGWVCSRIGKTALLDLDFQNQGCTGLFAPHVKLPDDSVLEVMAEDIRESEPDLCQVADGLYFLPAVSWGKQRSQEEALQALSTDDLARRLGTLIDQLAERHGFQIVLLDCHGGVDKVSLAAFRSADHTIMITEADSVTFAGTLELIRYYESGGMGADRSSRSGWATPSAADPGRPMKFVLNRLPSKYRWKDLETIYQQQLSLSLGSLSQDKSIFCYIPSEELLADSFGEYPFFVQLAPRSIFARKVHYMVHQLALTAGKAKIDYKPLARLEKDRYRRKTERAVVSHESRNTRNVVTSFAWLSTLLVVYLPFSIAWILLDTSEFVDATLGLVALASALPFFWYSTLAVLGLMFYYKNKHQFQRELFRAVSSRLTLWQRLSLFRLLILRIGTTFVPLLLIVYFMAAAIGFGLLLALLL